MRKKKVPSSKGLLCLSPTHRHTPTSFSRRRRKDSLPWCFLWVFLRHLTSQAFLFLRASQIKVIALQIDSAQFGQLCVYRMQHLLDNPPANGIKIKNWHQNNKAKNQDLFIIYYRIITKILEKQTTHLNNPVNCLVEIKASRSYISWEKNRSFFMKLRVCSHSSLLLHLTMKTLQG